MYHRRWMHALQLDASRVHESIVFDCISPFLIERTVWLIYNTVLSPAQRTRINVSFPFCRYTYWWWWYIAYKTGAILCVVTSIWCFQTMFSSRFLSSTFTSEMIAVVSYFRYKFIYIDGNNKMTALEKRVHTSYRRIHASDSRNGSHFELLFIRLLLLLLKHYLTCNT